MTYIISKDFEISCSHRLWDDEMTENENKELFGKCGNAPNHGHNYFVTVTLRGKKLKNGMIRNFTEVKKIFMEKIDSVYDHHYLNECEPFKSHKLLTTAENMCKVFFDILKKDVPELYSISIKETERSSAMYIE